MVSTLRELTGWGPVGRASVCCVPSRLPYLHHGTTVHCHYGVFPSLTCKFYRDRGQSTQYSSSRDLLTQ